MLAKPLMLSVLPLLAIAMRSTPRSAGPVKQGLIIALKINAYIIDRDKACLSVWTALDQGFFGDQFALSVQQFPHSMLRNFR